MAEEKDRTEPEKTPAVTPATPTATKTPSPAGKAVGEAGIIAAPPEGIGEYSPEARKPKPVYRRPAFLIGVAIILIVGAILGLRYWLYARAHESTDDAFIDGHIIQISPKVVGNVTKIYVLENQQVKEGELLVEIDSRDYESKLSQAKAALEAGEAKLNEARSGVALTRANTNAGVHQASATVQRAKTEVSAQSAAAAAERSRISQANAGIATAEANVAQAKSQEVSAAADAVRADADVQRYQALFDKDEISRQRLDQAVATARMANAAVEAARSKVAASQAQVNEARAMQNVASENARQAQVQVAGKQAGVGEAEGRLMQANTGVEQVAVSEAQADTAGATIEQLRASVAQAELELSYTKIYAPAAGRVTRKAVEEGAMVQLGQPLLAIVPGEVWVTANFKESQVGKMQPNQPVEITVDAYPDKVFKGHIDSIQAGTGARFSLLPPENAAGNYVKVVQRIPVKIVFDEQPDPRHMLAPGMSVVPEVKVK